MKNKEIANNEFEKILKSFNATDIKYTGENEDTEFNTKSYIANIKNTEEYNEWINSIKNSNEYKYDPSFEDYVKYTDFGEINVTINEDFITIEVKYNIEDESIIECHVKDIKKIKEDWHDNWVEPTIDNDSCETYQGFDIYKGTDESGDETYYIFFENDPMPEPGYEEWQAETIELAKERCDLYEDPEDEIGIYTGGDPNELDESMIPIQESDKDNEEEYYQRNIYDILDNITALADSYDNAENDEKLKALGQTISRIEDELKTLKKIHMDAVTGIKHITL